MPNVFKRLRKSLLEEGKLRKYLLYAFGEILLVVIGILLALQINDWNDNRKKAKALNGIFYKIQQELSSDTLEASALINVYEAKVEKMGKIIKKEINAEELAACLDCIYAHTNYVEFSINNKGVEMLRNFYDDDVVSMDSLTIALDAFYASSSTYIPDLSKSIKEDALESVLLYRNNYEWFTDYSIAKKTPVIIEYMLNNKENKNRLTFHKMLLEGNLIPMLKSYRAQAGELLEEISRKIEN